MSLDVAGRQAKGVEAQNGLIKTVKTALMLRNQYRLKITLAITRDITPQGKTCLQRISGCSGSSSPSAYASTAPSRYVRPTASPHFDRSDKALDQTTKWPHAGRANLRHQNRRPLLAAESSASVAGNYAMHSLPSGPQSQRHSRTALLIAPAHDQSDPRCE